MFKLFKEKSYPTYIVMKDGRVIVGRMTEKQAEQAKEVLRVFVTNYGKRCRIESFEFRE